MSPPSNDEAVSPVVAVIVMIAVTVVLAGVLFAVIAGIKSTSENTENVGFKVDETADSLYVIKVEEQPFWSTYEVSLSVAGDFELGMAVAAGGDALLAGVFASMGGAPNGPADARVAAGSTMYFCAEPGPANGVDIAIRHVGANTLIFKGKFLTLMDCPP